MIWTDRPLVEINENTPLSVIDEIGDATIRDCAAASYGIGNHWQVDWERFYEHLEMHGWDMQDLGGSVDNKIRRMVREMVKKGNLE